MVSNNIVAYCGNVKEIHFMKKNKFTKVIAIVLAITMLSACFGAVTVGASSAYPVIGNESGDVLGVILSDIIDTLLRILTDFFSSLFNDGPGFVPEDDEALADKIAANYYEGTGKNFQTSAAEGAKWQLGYSNASLIPADYDNGSYYIGGYIAPENGFSNVVEGIAEIPGIGRDDMKVRAMAISDKTGRGTVLFAVVDCIGITNADIKDIRALLKDYAAANNIVSINVSSTHTHSCIDTEGLWTKNIVKLVSNGIINGTNSDDELQQGTNPAYMAWMKEVVADTLKKAHLDMKDGSLTYTTKDLGQDYFQNKNRPSAGELIDVDDNGNIIADGNKEIAMTNIERFIFTPEDGSKKTMIINLAAHPDVAGLPTSSNSGREISGDYIFYCGKYLEEKANMNFMFFQGAIAGIYMARGATGDGVPTKQRVEESQRYGYELARMALNLTSTEEEAKNNPITNDNAAEIEEYTSLKPLVDANGNVIDEVANANNSTYLLLIDAVDKTITDNADTKTLTISDHSGVIYTIAYGNNGTFGKNDDFGVYTITSPTGLSAVIFNQATYQGKDVTLAATENSYAILDKETGEILLGQNSGSRIVVSPCETISGARQGIKKSEKYTVWYTDWNADGVPVETEVEPFLNLYLKQVEVPVSNTLITAIGKLNMANYIIKANKDGTYSIVTEIGYMELGKQFKTVFLPGEIVQDIVAPNGASLEAVNSITAKPFSDFVEHGATSASDIFGKDVKCFGLMNDAIGYVVPDNDYTMGDPANHYHELISLGQHVASSLIDGLYELEEELVYA